MLGPRNPFLPMPFIAPSSTNPVSAPPPMPLPAAIHAARLSTLAGELEDEVRARAISKRLETSPSRHAACALVPPSPWRPLTRAARFVPCITQAARYVDEWLENSLDDPSLDQ